MSVSQTAGEAARRRAAELLAAPEHAETRSSQSIDEICRLITAHRWRRSSVDADLAADIRSKVTQQVTRDAPIVFSVPFGGYKSWRQESFPHLNWAEPMWIERLRHFGTSVAAAYQPGVQFEFTYYSHALDLINNLPLEHQETYVREFDNLLALRTSPQVRFHLVDLVTEHADIDDFRRNLNAAIDAFEASGYEPSPRQVASAHRNLVPCGVRDLTDVSESERDILVIASAQACAAMESLPQRKAYNKGTHRIQLSHLSGSSLALHIASTDVSTHQPWVGVGYLTPSSDERWHDTIAARVPACEWHEIKDVDQSLGPGLERLATAVLQ